MYFFIINNLIKMKKIIKNEYNNKKSFLRMSNTMNVFLWNIIIFHLIKHILTDQSQNYRDIKNIVYMKFLPLKRNIRIINRNYLPDLIYVDGIQTGIQTEINFADNINFENSKLINITMIWNYEITDCSHFFFRVENAIEIDLSKFDTSKVKSMFNMFNDCNQLKYINFGNIDTSSVTDMSFMFSDCISLSSLNLSNFNTSNVYDMRNMFQNCSSLTFLNLSNFDTSHLKRAGSIFKLCKSLISLDLKKFNTSIIIDMNSLFEDCSSLKTLNLNNFNTPSIQFMDGMFKGCSSLISMDLSNFDTSNVQKMNELFSDCHSLKYVNLSSFITSKTVNVSSMFLRCHSLISIDISNFYIDNSNMDYLFCDCISLKKIIFPKTIKPISVILCFQDALLYHQ